jgi:hypothetical protein
MRTVRDQHEAARDQDEDRKVVEIGQEPSPSGSATGWLLRIIAIRASFVSVRLHRPGSASESA